MKYTGILFILFLASAAFAQKSHQLKVTIGDSKVTPLQSKAYLVGYYVNQRRLIDSTEAANTLVLKFNDSVPHGLYTVMLYTDLKDVNDKYQRLTFDVIYSGIDAEFKVNVTDSKNFGDVEALSGENLAYNTNFITNKNFELKQTALEGALLQYPKGDEFYPQLEAQLKKIKQARADFTELPCDKQKTPYTCTYVKAIRSSEKKLLDEVDFTDTILKNSPFISGIAWDYLNVVNNDSLLQGPMKTEKQKERLDKLLPLLKKDANVFRLMTREILRYYESTRNNEIALYITEKYLPQAAGADAEKIKEKAKILESLRPGQPAPNIELSIMGFKQKLYDIKAKHLLLLFWDTDCPHCQELSAELLEFYHLNKSKGLEVVALALDASEKDWLNYIAEHKMDWLNFLDPDGWKSQAVKEYNVHSTPSMFLLDENKKIEGNYATMGELRGKLL